MKIAIIGNSYFGPILTEQLTRFDRENSYIFYNTNEKVSDKIKFLLSIFVIDVVYSLSASISGGGALKIARIFNKKIIQHFIGSDVLDAQSDYKENKVNKSLYENSRFLCEVSWIRDELKEIGVNAEIVSIMAYESNIQARKFKNFNILTYIGKGKEDFYGMIDLIALAKKLPLITFKIAGLSSYKKSLPSNIKLLGWVNMIDELQKSVIYIRNVKHDGLAFSVIEALSLGRIVFYNYRFENTQYYESIEDLSNLINEYKNEFDNNRLTINTKAIAFIKEEYKKEQVLERLKNILLEDTCHK